MNLNTCTHHLKILFSTILLILLSACSEPVKVSSATDNVIVLPVSFYLDRLDRERSVRLYLPPNYASSDKTYPVVYMHDGQNLFDDASAFLSEWGIDESLNLLATEKGLELIVVGIDNGGEKRMNELSPWPNKRFGAAEGREYMDFITEVVKPYIDTNYRSKPERQHTAIMGSSMGGLISHFAIHEYPQVFSKAGIFSPSYWYSQQVFEHTRTARAAADAKLYIMYGGNEGDGMIGDVSKMQRQLKFQGHPRQNMLFKRVEGGEHNETFWRAQFPAAIEWLFQ
ncbi:MAG: putative alpha/beta superfamily hydrolase [Paraglaciecola sp.]|jgi:predicted alpha/beta superfamily hydrolase